MGSAKKIHFSFNNEIVIAYYRGFLRDRLTKCYGGYLEFVVLRKVLILFLIIWITSLYFKT